MGGNPGVRMLCILVAAGLAGGCKPKPPDAPAPPAAYFKTPFQNESQFIVEAIVSELAEEMFYAKSQRLPDTAHFLVSAKEKPGSPLDAAVYELQVRMGAKQSDLKLDVSIAGPIWSPAVYESVAAALARALGLEAGHGGGSAETNLLSKLTDGTPETIEEENQEVSAALQKDFRNPELHEEAAMLLGAFLFRDHSGNFFEIRTPLCRMTAHLAMARFLRGADTRGVNGAMAEAVMLTLVNDQAPALERLKAFDTNDTAVAAMVRALRTRDTGDYRPLGQVKDRSRLESVEWFSAMADYAGMPLAWLKLSDEQKQTIDFVRAANQGGYSVEIGHQLLAVSMALELQELTKVYELSRHEKLTRDGLVKALNELPEGCLQSDSNGGVQVRIIGWGQWAMFLQRHLCHACQQNFRFLQYMWGVPDEAREFAAQCDTEFAGLRLYPFVRRFNCTDVKSYHESEDEGFKLTVATPQLVPAECWNYLCYKVSFAPLYVPSPNPHVNEWHSHNPPPGTVYDLNPRLRHPSLTERPGVVARFEKLHELAPYDCRISNFILKRKYNEHATYDQATALYGEVLAYSVYALRAVAQTVHDEPERYEKVMLQAAELDPSCYYDLGDYNLTRQQEDKAAQYIDKASVADPDRVRAASHAEWRVRYYLKKGQTDKARQIADEAGEVYSYTGLVAKALFLEAMTNYDGAFEWYAKIEERYSNSIPVIAFCLRYKAETSDRRFEPDVQKRLDKLFPKGLEKVSLNDFHSPPADGVLIKQENEALQSAGLKASNVVVAVYGVRVHNLRQYMYGRDLKDTPELDLIVWQGDAYREFKPSPPHHRFGVEFDDYLTKRRVNQ